MIRPWRALIALSMVLVLSSLCWSMPATVTPVFDRDYLPKAREIIGKARHSIDVAIYMFKTANEHNNASADLQEELIRAAKRGVKIRVLFDHPGKETDFIYEANIDTARELLAFGIECYFDNPKRRMHAKMMVIDNRFTLLGSHNYTVSGMNHNDEASVLIDSEPFAKQSRAYIEQIIRKGKRIQK
ncbi:phospholipase D-like domain-containing protein [Chrysiogenes arsenatis]|uniref:phospholipase D-like domain-containing protein n=1 Tax=Chrysiogenes arsenatis TaxID=309797 RepID=UPI001268B48E|nr:phospholipase D-like domain-containing protein [Chrysiogenes arsenatis]